MMSSSIAVCNIACRRVTGTILRRQRYSALSSTANSFILGTATVTTNSNTVGGSSGSNNVDHGSSPIGTAGCSSYFSTKVEEEPAATDTSAFSYAVVNHADAYRESMAGRHGKQLQLAYDEGLGKDDDVDYFAEEEEGQEEEDEDYESDEEEEEKDDEAEVAAEDDDEDLSDDEEDDFDEDGDIQLYNNDGSLIRPESELIALRSGAPAGGAFAILQLGGFQHKVAVHDVLIMNKLRPVDTYKVGATITLTDEHVLLMADTERTLVGLPSVAGAEVDVMVEEITRDKTVIVFKKRRRKNSRRKNGHRREVTFLRILDIRMPGATE